MPFPLRLNVTPGPRSARLLSCLLGGALVLGSGCKDETSAPPLSSLAPAPLPRMSGGAGGVLALTPHGAALPKDAMSLELTAATLAGGRALALAGQVGSGGKVILRPDAEAYLAQAAPLLTVLADRGAEVWFAHPDGAFGYRILLFDEPAYQEWIDLPEPGRLRVVMRGDGYELTTSVGKLPGPDANGPSVPLRQGRHDLGRLRLGLEALLDRFSTEDMLCWVPSFGMELSTLARSMAATYDEDGEPLLARQCVVFPRPKAEGAPAPE